MRSRAAVVLVLVLATLIGGCEPGPTPADAYVEPSDTNVPCRPVDFIAALADPLAPARRLPGRAFLDSSRAPEPQSGMHNDDSTHFAGVDGDHVILAAETGPGVLTRLWFTMGPPDMVTASDVLMRLTIDGRDVILDERLGDLASPTSTTFPAPWSMDPTVSSGGLSISAPIHYQQNARVELIVAPGLWAYYQVDGRRLPSDACVPSFTGSYSAEQLASLATAATIWRDHQHPGDDHMVAALDLAPGASTEYALDGVGAITTLEVLTPLGTRDEIALRVEIDGDVAADAPLAWLTGSDSPAGTYAAALTASSPSSAISYAPMPFDTHARVVVTNHAAAAVSVGLRVRVLAMSTLPSDVGHFRAECSSATAHIPIPIEEPPFMDTFPNVVIGESMRGPGQFAGITTFQTAPSPWWWSLEPDHEIAIDGRYDLLGTGTEDYFGGGFYFHEGPYASVTSGASGWDRPDGTVMPIPDAHTHLYRHHLVDTWPFDSDMRFEMESYVDGTRFDGCIFTYLFSSAAP